MYFASVSVSTMTECRWLKVPRCESLSRWRRTGVPVVSSGRHRPRVRPCRSRRRACRRPLPKPLLKELLHLRVNVEAFGVRSGHPGQLCDSLRREASVGLVLGLQIPALVGIPVVRQGCEHRLVVRLAGNLLVAPGALPRRLHLGLAVNADALGVGACRAEDGP